MRATSSRRWPVIKLHQGNVIRAAINSLLSASWAKSGYTMVPTDLLLPPEKFSILSSIIVSTAGSEVAQSQGRLSETDQNGNLVVLGSLQQPASVATDGVYIVKAIDYTGDTRGQAWYMDMMCFARGARELQSTSSINKTSG
jgi:prophage tail gpP-like protein